MRGQTHKKPNAHHPMKSFPLITEDFKVKQPERQPQSKERLWRSRALSQFVIHSLSPKATAFINNHIDFMKLKSGVGRQARPTPSGSLIR